MHSIAHTHTHTHTHITCMFNSKHSGVIGYGLEEIYCYVTGQDCLDGAHSSIVDAIAQSYIVGHEEFQKFWDNPVGIVEMSTIWETNVKKNRAAN